MQAEYLAQVRNRMVNTPEAVFRDITVQLDQAIAAGEGPDAQRRRVQQFLSPTTGDWTGRAMTVARTESAGAMSHATIEAAALRNEVLGEELEQTWICTLDSKTRRSHYAADGQRVPLGGTFSIAAHSSASPATHEDRWKRSPTAGAGSRYSPSTNPCRPSRTGTPNVDRGTPR